MKTIFLIFTCFTFLTLSIYSQDNEASNRDNPLHVKEYKLDNGLTVYLNEDHLQPNVYGGVVVKGGSKRDPHDATGIAHYLEHMMFKGTHEMGTVDYEKEKIYLDSINYFYDELGKTQNKKKRLNIQKKINDLSVKAGDFAIPNEFDRIVSEIGGTGVNAYTSEDAIVYFNFFPSNQIEKWLEIYSHRFINPVFRLFQAELETVYEEKNMSMDNFFSAVFEAFNKNFYKKHPYGQQSILGEIDHLKNPSLTKMYEYYNTYYVANNMALILSGDFNTEEVMPLIETKFGRWRSGEIPPLPDYKEEPFNGREKVVTRLTPIPIGAIGYRTVPQGHADETALDVCNNILSNEASTGLFDKLYMDNKIMSADMMHYQNIDYGGAIVLIIPKLIGQSIKKAEKLVLNEIERVKNGDFEDDILEAIKLNLKKNHFEKLESMRWRQHYMTKVFLQGKSWKDFLNYPDELDKITKQDVINIANKYYGNDCLAFYSKTGIPKKKKLDKPTFKAIVPKSSEEESVFSKELEKIEEKISIPKFIEFNKDVKFEDIKEKVHLYYTPNPINDIFSLSLRFGVGKHKFPVLGYAAEFLSLIGTDNHSFEEFNKELQKIGSSFNVSSSRDYFRIYIDGLEENFEETIGLINELLTQMKPDDSQLEKFYDEAKTERKVEIKDPYTIGYALKSYSLYMDSSYYLSRLSLDEIKKINSDTLIKSIKEALKWEVDIFYCGKKDLGEVSNLLNDNFQFPDNPVKSTSPVSLNRDVPRENLVYLLNDKKVIQSQVYIIMEGETNDEHGIAIAKAFNEYFGGSMNSIIFQEIREFRSFAYSAWGYYYVPFRKNERGYFQGFLSTQSDKTTEALKVMVSLLDSIPRKEERLKTIKSSLRQSINANRPSFRSLSYRVAYWRKQGYNNDPRKEQLKIYEKMNFEDLIEFYNRQLRGHKLIITIAGDKSRIDMDELAKFGKIIEVTKKDIFR